MPMRYTAQFWHQAVRCYLPMEFKGLSKSWALTQGPPEKSYSRGHLSEPLPLHAWEAGWGRWWHQSISGEETDWVLPNVWWIRRNTRQAGGKWTWVSWFYGERTALYNLGYPESQRKLTFFNQCCTTDTASLSTTSTSCNKVANQCPQNMERPSPAPLSISNMNSPLRKRQGSGQRWYLRYSPPSHHQPHSPNWLWVGRGAWHLFERGCTQSMLWLSSLHLCQVSFVAPSFHWSSLRTPLAQGGPWREVPTWLAGQWWCDNDLL